jgi:hypothetical protein
MKTRFAVILLLLMGTLCPFQAVSADSLFYTGDIIVESINMTVEADAEATVNAVYLLTNRGSEDQGVDLQFAQSPVALDANGEGLSNPVLFSAGETKSISLTCTLNITGETAKMLFLDPTMLLDGKPSSEPTKALLIEALLPGGINGLAWASQEPDGEGFEGSRRSYSWSSSDVYPTTLCLKWSTLQVEISVEKSATPQVITSSDQTIGLEITLRNNGNTTVNKIALADLFTAFEFEAVAPSWEFSEQGTWLVWTKNINRLEPGQSENVTYSVKYIGSGAQNYDFDLRPCVVTVDGHLVSVSNKVRMSRNIQVMPAPPDPEVPPESEADPLHFPSLPVIGGIVIILAIARGGYVIWRRRRTKDDVN